MIKKLMQSTREYKKDTVLTPIFVTVETVLEMAIPTLMALLIDNGIEKQDMSYVFYMGTILLVFAAIAMINGFFAGKHAAIASAGFAKNLRHDIFYNIQSFSFSNIDKFSSASLITRLTTDITNIQNAFQMVIRIAVRSPMVIIFALFFAFRIDPQLSLAFLAAIPVLGLGLFIMIKLVFPIFEKTFKAYDSLNNVVQENLHGIRVVKSYTREGHEVEKFGAVSQLIFKLFSKAEKIIAINMPLFFFCLYGIILILSWVGAVSIIESGNNPDLGLSTGELTGLIAYTMQILMSLMMLSMVFVMIIISKASAKRIVEVLDEKSTLQNGENHVTIVKDGSISFENVTFSYSDKNEKPVLNGISLDIASGDTVGILGGTGSSKSSLVQLIPRLYDAVSGCVKVGGIDVRNYDIEALRDEVAMVLQKNVLFSGTIKENLRWGNQNAGDDELINACKLAQAHDFIMEFKDGYDTHIEQGGTNVSGGQRQRLCIARALLKNPKIIIFDDSTSAVDTKTERQIADGLENSIPNTTKIIIAQRVSSVKRADKIVVMEDGKLSAVGTHDELLKSSVIYREVYESQCEGGALSE